MPKIRLHSVLVLICSEAGRPLKFQRLHTQGGTSISGGLGGLDLKSSLEAKFGARSGQLRKIRGKTWEVLLPQDAKVGKKVPMLGSNLKFRGQNLEYLSPIFLEAKFGRPTIISEAKV